MFVENKKKSSTTNIEEGEIHNKEVKYISTLNTRRNPDLLVPGEKFLKGSHYFKGNEEIITKEGSESDVS